MKFNLITLALSIMISCGAFAQSTSPNPNLFNSTDLPVQTLAENSSEVITFSEFSTGTFISNQYQDIGIIFSGSGAFITSDGSNPTSPVLSGTPLFQGSITGTFVRPGTDEPTIVKSFTYDAGFFDEFGSTRIEWFDSDGKKLGQRINSTLGIETFTIEGGNIATWRISIIETEPAGFAIDNVSFVPVGSSILFREKSGDDKDGTWGFFVDEIPGFDHVGFHIENEVYESHPGYVPSGTYVSSDGEESILINSENGVQSQHSRGTFEHDSQSTGYTPVIDFDEIPIDDDLANNMRTHIESVSSATFQFIDYSLAGLEATLSPASQKGGGNSFTCVGLVEWAAENAGHRNGAGFIPNAFESFIAPDPSTFPPGLIEVPLLSPQLLNYAMKGQNLLHGAKQWIQGFFDPVDFILIDPLGRQFGFVQGVGFLNEIPNSFYSGDGGVEQILIPTAIPGPYTIQFVGVGENVFAAVSALGVSESFSDPLPFGEIVEKKFFVEPMVGSAGDVSGDGNVDSEDIDALIPQLNNFTDGLGHPGDLDGDGLLSNTDLILLIELVGILEIQLVDIDIKPGSNLNPVNCNNSNGVIPVAILTNDAFDATTVDHTTVTFEGASETHIKNNTGLPKRHEEDVDDDGDIDLVFHFRLNETELTCESTEAKLIGETYDGLAIEGVDLVTMINNGNPNINIGGGLSKDHDYSLTISPNPFKEGTDIRFQLPRTSKILVKVYNILGKEVSTLTNKSYESGHHIIHWDGLDSTGEPIASGIYFTWMKVDGSTTVKKMHRH